MESVLVALIFSERIKGVEGGVEGVAMTSDHNPKFPSLFSSHLLVVVLMIFPFATKVMQCMLPSSHKHCSNSILLSS